MMFCEKCGAQLQDDDAFCQTCGAKAPAAVENTVNAKREGDSAVQHKELSASQYNGNPAAMPIQPPQAVAETPNPYHSPKEKEKRKGKKKDSSRKKVAAGVVSGVAATAVVAGGIIAYHVLTSPAHQAARLINDQKYDEAFEMYANSDKEPAFVRKITNSLVKKLNSIKKDFTNKQITYDDAKAQLQEIEQFNFPEVQTQLSDISAYINRMQESFTAFNKGTEALSQGKYADAVGYLKNVIEDDPDHDSAVNSLNDAIKQYADNTLSESEQLLSKKDYKGALGKLKTTIDAIAPLAKNEEQKPLEDKYNEYKSVFVSETMNQVKTEKENKNYDKAKSIIQEALNVVSDESLSAELTAIDAERPLKLEELKLSESENFTQITDLTETNDVVGNTYSPNNLFQISANADGWGSGYEGYADYYVNYKYKRLTGTIAVADSSAITNATLTIYGDKNIIWSSQTLNRTTPPKEIDVDLSNVDWLEFKLTMDEEAPDGTLDVLLSNLQFVR